MSETAAETAEVDRPLIAEPYDPWEMKFRTHFKPPRLSRREQPAEKTTSKADDAAA